MLESIYKGRLPEIKQQVIEMSLNGSGIRDTARVLQISPTTVMNELKKGVTLSSVNTPLVSMLHPGHGEIHSDRSDEAEVDEMWSFVKKKPESRWLWPAIDHQSGKVLA